jgi:hypothetical protein
MRKKKQLELPDLNFFIEGDELVVCEERNGRTVAGPLKAWMVLGGKPSDYKMKSIKLVPSNKKRRGR